MGNIRGNHPEHQPGLLGKGLVLREIGGNGQNFSPGDCQCPEYCCQLRCGTAHEEQILRRGTCLIPII